MISASQGRWTGLLGAIALGAAASCDFGGGCDFLLRICQMSALVELMKASGVMV
jgi:hypothetical protein